MVPANAIPRLMTISMADALRGAVNSRATYCAPRRSRPMLRATSSSILVDANELSRMMIGTTDNRIAEPNRMTSVPKSTLLSVRTKSWSVDPS